MRTLILSISVSLILAACGGTDQNAESDMSDNSMAQATTDKTIITAMEISPSDFSHYFMVQGMVEAEQNAQLFPEAPGKITSILVQEGDNVKKGETLMTLDSRVVSNQIREIKSRLELAKTVYEKQKILWNDKIGSEIQYLEAKNNYEALQSSLEALQAQQNMYVMSAPFSGVIDEIVPKQGEMASPQMPVFRLINMTKVYLKADVTERYLGQVNAGDSVLVAFPSIGHSVATTVKRLGNYINPNNRTFKMRLDLPNANQKLKPNLLAEIRIRDYHAKNAVVIPSTLVQLSPSGQEFVYTVENGIAKKVEIETGMTYKANVEVISGLEKNVTLIDKGARSVQDGEEVEIRS